MANERREEMEIDLSKLLRTYLGKWWLIVLATVLAGVLALVITQTLITPMYRASVTLYVNNIKSGEQVEYITSSNLATAQKLVNTYVNIIKSDTVLEKVAETARLDISAAQLRKVMSAAQVDETEIFNVIITHPDPEMAAQIANAVAEVAPDEIAHFVEGSSAKIIDYAKVPKNPSSPSTARNTVLGALLGALLAVAYVTLLFVLDVRIKDEEDLAALFELPVLAQIPSFDTNEKMGGYGYEMSAAKGEVK